MMDSLRFPPPMRSRTKSGMLDVKDKRAYTHKKTKSSANLNRLLDFKNHFASNPEELSQEESRLKPNFNSKNSISEEESLRDNNLVYDFNGFFSSNKIEKNLVKIKPNQEKYQTLSPIKNILKKTSIDEKTSKSPLKNNVENEEKKFPKLVKKDSSSTRRLRGRDPKDFLEKFKQNARRIVSPIRRIYKSQSVMNLTKSIERSKSSLIKNILTLHSKETDIELFSLKSSELYDFLTANEIYKFEIIWEKSFQNQANPLHTTTKLLFYYKGPKEDFSSYRLTKNFKMFLDDLRQELKGAVMTKEVKIYPNYHTFIKAKKSQKLFFVCETKNYNFPAHMIFLNKNISIVTIISFKRNFPTKEKCDIYEVRPEFKFDYLTQKERSEINITTNRRRRKYLKSKHPAYIFITIIPDCDIETYFGLNFHSKIFFGKMIEDKYDNVKLDNDKIEKNIRDRKKIENFKIDYSEFLNFSLKGESRFAARKKKRRKAFGKLDNFYLTGQTEEEISVKKFQKKNMVVANNFKEYDKMRLGLFQKIQKKRAHNVKKMQDLMKKDKYQQYVEKVTKRRNQRIKKLILMGKITGIMLREINKRVWITTIVQLLIIEKIPGFMEILRRRKNRSNKAFNFTTMIVLNITKLKMRNGLLKMKPINDKKRIIMLLRARCQIMRKTVIKNSKKKIWRFLKVLKSKTEIKLRILNYYKRENKKLWVQLYSKTEWPKTIKHIAKLAKIDTDYTKFKDILEFQGDISENKVEEIFEQVYRIESYYALKHNIIQKMNSTKYNKFSLKKLEHFIVTLKLYPVWKSAKDQTINGKMNKKFYKSAMEIIGQALLAWKKKNVKPKKKKLSKIKGKFEVEKRILDNVDDEEELDLKLRDRNRFNFYLSQNFMIALVMNAFNYRSLVNSKY